MMKLVLNKLTAFMMFFCSSVQAQWTGITLGFGDEIIPIHSNNQQYHLTPSNIRLSIEGKTKSNLRLGVAAAQSNAEIKNNSLTHQQALQGFQLFFKAPYQLNDYFELEAEASITQFFTPDSNSIESLDWLTKQVSLALFTSLYPIRLGAKIHLRTISGELQIPSQHLFFNEQQTTYMSYSIDYLTEKTAYIRLQLTEHSDNTFQIIFAKVY